MSHSLIQMLLATSRHSPVILLRIREIGVLGALGGIALQFGNTKLRTKIYK